MSTAREEGSNKPTKRAERARQTRRRIIDSAATLFLEHGYGPTTLDQVAERAGVAVQTVYFHFGNKATLLKQALDLAAVGDDEPVALLDRPWFDQLKNERDPDRIIELWIATSRSIFERIAPIMTVIRGTMGSEPELAAQWHVNEQERLTAYRALVEILNDRNLLKPGLDVQEAAELTFLLVSIENYFLATSTLGWTPDRWEQSAVSLLVTTLTAPSQGHPA